MIHKEYDFKNLSYTNFIYNKREKLFVLCETGGELHIYNKNFDLIKKVQDNKCLASYITITDLHPEHLGYLGIKSNYSVNIYDYHDDKMYPIYESKISNILETKNSIYYSNQYSLIFFKNEEGKYMSYSYESKLTYELPSVSNKYN